MGDIIERLRSQRTEQGDLWPIPNLHDEAAEEIENLRERLEKAHSFISRADWMQFFEEEHAAAAALREGGDE